MRTVPLRLSLGFSIKVKHPPPKAMFPQTSEDVAMARKFTPKIVTANDLFEGDVIYLTGEGGWSRNHCDAKPAENEEQANALLGQAQKQAGRIVGPYLADIVLDEAGRPKPAHFREAFRSRGPSNYFHGKQAN